MLKLDQISSSADDGLRFVSEDMAARPSPFAKRGPVAPMQPWSTASTGIYMIDVEAKMDQINVSSTTLDGDVQRNVVDPFFRTSWDAWLASWRKYYADTHRFLTRLLSNPFRADEINREVESRRLQLIGWYDGYAQQKGRDGLPVPSATGQSPIVPPTPKDEKTGAGLPWWFWLVGGALLVGVGYLVYRKIGEGRAKAAYVHKHAPGILERYLGPLGKPAYEYSQAGRDPRDPNFEAARDVSRPFQLSSYARDPSPVSAVHRGFPVGDRDEMPFTQRRDEMLFEEPQRDLPRPPRYFEVERDPYFDYDHDLDFEDYP